ncbi:DUF2277 domain-containing protein [Xylanimonas ulmi]|uniref:DUF2277 domain-containing protein n=1 Tax=Xylanimonas ulmi TaxID=228973 RepID=A0A4Q7M2J5_9MICO|nr:DUF2277 domain-containing protein [Xylanibacterium ulmi]RZS61057.1 hypothetical protein EV386_1345 [Xylanibacterium ulmi]
MCRNITTLRGLEPPATDAEVRAAAEQFVRKVTGVQAGAAASTREPCERAAAQIAAVVDALLAELPPRKVPPRTVPPLRRADVQARVAARMREREEHERLHALGVAHTHGAGR